MPCLTRRDFLKLSSSGALSLALAELRLDRTFSASAIRQGRVTVSGIPLYDAPSFNAKKTHVFGRDEVVAVEGEVEGDEGNPYNKTWYINRDWLYLLRLGPDGGNPVTRRPALIFPNPGRSPK